LPAKVQNDDVLSVSLKRKKGNMITRAIKISQLPAVKAQDAMSKDSLENMKYIFFILLSYRFLRSLCPQAQGSFKQAMVLRQAACCVILKGEGQV
jgi:hypothetical protein